MKNSNVTKTICPHVKWAQRKDKLYITVEVENLVNPQVDLTNEGNLKFKYNANFYFFIVEQPIK